MTRTIEVQEHYGAAVYTHVEMDELRRSECLCRLCCRLVPGNDAGNCPTAQGLFNICKLDDVAMSVTRCPRFSAKVSVQ